MIRILVNGAKGKMGQQAVLAIKSDPELELAAEAGRGDNLASMIQNSGARVVVDLTTPEAVFENTWKILEMGVYPVVGTSGLSPDKIKQLQAFAASKSQGGIIVPNFSLGAVLMIQCAQKIAAHFQDIEILEMHHAQKKDAPSGTALYTEVMLKDKTKQAVPIHSVRLPGLVARQQILFGALGETLTLDHNVIDRAAFMPGMLLACKKVGDLDRLVVGLEHLLN